MAKITRLTKFDIASITLNLDKGKSKEKKAAVIKVGKFLIKELSGVLFEAYVNLNKTNKNWELQVEMIKSLGRLKEKKAIPFLQDIVDENKYEDMITIEATKALIRTKYTNSYNIYHCILSLLKTGNKSVKDGAIALLSCDNISIDEENMESLIELIDSDNEFDDDLDYREYLISAMSAWPKQISKSFFEKYKNDNRINQDVIKYAEKGKRYHLDY